jgi:hypothetical protein
MHIERHQAARDLGQALRDSREILAVVMERLPRDGDLNSVQFAAQALAARLIMTGGDIADICQAIDLRARAIWAWTPRRIRWPSRMTGRGAEPPLQRPA